jgi:hypothetical protein
MKFSDLNPKQKRLVILLPLVAVVGAVLSGFYNAAEPSRAAQDSAVVRAAADVSVVIPSGTADAGTRAVTMPFRNDSPDAITLTSLYLPFAGQLSWTSQPLTVQPGHTGYPLVLVPASCLAGFPAAGSGPLRTTPVKHSATEEQLITVYIKVTTVDGNTHGITLGANGALAAAAYKCGQLDD